jgi:hypothetical protein
VRGVNAEHAHFTRSALAVALEDLQRGGLAGPVGTEETQDLACLDAKVEPLQHLAVAVPHLQATDCDHRVCHLRLLLSRVDVRLPEFRASYFKTQAALRRQQRSSEHHVFPRPMLHVRHWQG